MEFVKDLRKLNSGDFEMDYYEGGQFDPLGKVRDTCTKTLSIRDPDWTLNGKPLQEEVEKLDSIRRGETSLNKFLIKLQMRAFMFTNTVASVSGHLGSVASATRAAAVYAAEQGIATL